jgi:hypothetical protein
MGSFIEHIRRYAPYLQPLSDNALLRGGKQLLTRGYEFLLPGAMSVIQDVSKRALQLWKRIQNYSEDICSGLSCHNVAKYTEVYLR